MSTSDPPHDRRPEERSASPLRRPRGLVGRRLNAREPEIVEADEPNAETSDEDLVMRLAEGDEQAIAHLHRRYAPHILRMATRALDRPAAEEITQDVMLVVWRNAKTFDPARGRVHSWILRITQRRIINELRRRSRRPFIVAGTDSPHISEQIDSGLEPDAAAWRAVRNETLRDAVEGLPPTQSDAVRLAFLEQLTHEQISRLLDLPLGTTKTRVRAGLSSLRRHTAVLTLLACVLALVAVVGVGFNLMSGEQRDARRSARALRVLASSNATARRLEPVGQPPSPDTHASYRTRPGATTAVVTITHFAAPGRGLHYQLWTRQQGEWHRLAVIKPDVDGNALTIVEHDVELDPDELVITLERDNRASQPSTRVVAAWKAEPSTPVSPPDDYEPSALPSPSTRPVAGSSG